MTGPAPLKDNPAAVDEDIESRRQIRQALSLEPLARLHALNGAYSIFVVGQRRLGRRIFGGDR
jgi:hypothetical protein